MIIIPISINLFSWLLVPFILFFVLKRKDQVLQSLPKGRALAVIGIAELWYWLLFALVCTIYRFYSTINIGISATFILALPGIFVQWFLSMVIFGPQALYSLMHTDVVSLWGIITFGLVFIIIFWTLYIFSLRFLIKRYLAITTKQSYYYAAIFTLASLFCFVVLTVVASDSVVVLRNF